MYTIQTPSGYDKGDAFKIVWDNPNIFLPFDIVKGLDTLPPDNNDYKKYKKNNWWVKPKTIQTSSDIQHISYFFPKIESKEFQTLEGAINYCLEWRENFLLEQLFSFEI